ncbi:hypothetical protein D5b_00427 [Faustovirus]|nr:hypothetical protein D5b_00427 [Faustovirus]AMN84489.1 hypothetical protein D6_00078 [Faustovirus]QKE50185.1 putative prokaryotic membrane lipoprotein [Faustovirus]
MPMDHKRICDICTSAIESVARGNKWGLTLAMSTGCFLGWQHNGKSTVKPKCGCKSCKGAPYKSIDTLYTLEIRHQFQLGRGRRLPRRVAYPILNFTAPDMFTLKMKAWRVVKVNNLPIDDLPDDLKALFKGA